MSKHNKMGMTDKQLAESRASRFALHQKSKKKKPVGFFIEAYDTLHTEQNRRFLCNDGTWSNTVLLGNYGGALKLYKHEKRAINRAHALRHEAPHIRINYILSL